MRSVMIIYRATQAQYVEPQEDHIFSLHYSPSFSTSDKGLVLWKQFNLRDHLPVYADSSRYALYRLERQEFRRYACASTYNFHGIVFNCTLRHI